jgi:hypothetical protein
MNGSEVKNLTFNSIANLWLGFVWDEQSMRPEKWTSASWTKLGKCVNQTRPELNLR